MRRGGTCGHEGLRSFHAVATYKEADGGCSFADSQLQMYISGLVWLSNRCLNPSRDTQLSFRQLKLALKQKSARDLPAT